MGPNWWQDWDCDQYRVLMSPFGWQYQPIYYWWQSQCGRLQANLYRGEQVEFEYGQTQDGCDCQWRRYLKNLWQREDHTQVRWPCRESWRGAGVPSESKAESWDCADGQEWAQRSHYDGHWRRCQWCQYDRSSSRWYWNRRSRRYASCKSLRLCNFTIQILEATYFLSRSWSLP